MPLVDVTVLVFDFSSFSYCDRELKNFYDMTDMMLPVSNSAVVVHCWTVMWYVALIPSKEVSLMITAASVDSQSELGDIMSEY